MIFIIIYFWGGSPPQLGILNWESNWESPIGNPQLGIPNWESPIGNPQLGIPNWESPISNPQLEIPNWVKPHFLIWEVVVILLVG